MKVLIATKNPAKSKLFKKYLSSKNIEVFDLNDLKIKEKIEENGKTFEENSLAKAKFYNKLTGLPTIGDDGGFEIDALGGEPGVNSHRWIHGDREDEDEELIQHALIRLKDTLEEKRGAQLHLVIAFATPDGKTFTSEGIIRGVIPQKPSSYRRKGFPYRSLLYLPELKKFYNNDELTEEENRTYNHRRKAIEDLKPIIRQTLC